MRSRSAKLVVAGCLLAVPAALVPAAIGWADPAGCSAGNAGISSLNDGQLATSGSGSCDTTAYRNLQVEIKHDLSLRPDPVVDHANDVGSFRIYAVGVQSCDNGLRTATYYGRTFFTTNTTYHDSSHRSLTVC
jgi:hypothetical protein